MALNSSAVLFGRDFRVYKAAWNSTVTIPPDTIAYGTAWGTPSGQTGAWSEVGYTEGGLTVSAEVQRNEIRVDQSLDPIARPASGRNITMSTQLAEFTPANILASTGQGVLTTVAPTTGVRGHDDIDISSTITDTYLAVGFDILHSDLEAFRFILWKGLPSGAFTGTISAQDKAIIDFAMQGFPDTSTTPPRILKARDVSPAA